MKTDPDWRIDTYETLTRTFVNLLIFDRKCLLCTIPFLATVGEYPISIMTLEDPISTMTWEDWTITNGRCDVVLGYGGHPRKKYLAFALVAVEIKKRDGLCATASAQLVAYLGKHTFAPFVFYFESRYYTLVGLPQHCKAANKIIEFVHSIATDGVKLIFHPRRQRAESAMRHCHRVPQSAHIPVHRHHPRIRDSLCTTHQTPADSARVPPRG